MTTDNRLFLGIANWFARIDGVSKHLRLAMLGLTGLSTMSIGLKQYGLGEYTLWIIGTLVVVGLGFTYAYTELGIWNAMQRYRNDISDNYADPRGRINTELTARALFAAQNNRPLTESERQAVQEELDQAFCEYRDGIDVEKVQQRAKQ